MSIREFKSSFVIGALASVLGSAWTVPAQPAPGDSPARNVPPRIERPQPGFQPGRFAPFFERVLTDEQRASMREAMQSERGKLRELEEKLRDTRKELLQASVAEKFDEEVVRQSALAVGKLEAELAVLRAKALSKVRPPLSADQREKLRNPPPQDAGDGQGGPPPQLRRGEPRGDRPPPAQRDEHDLPLPPKPQP